MPPESLVPKLKCDYCWLKYLKVLVKLLCKYTIFLTIFELLQCPNNMNIARNSKTYFMSEAYE